MDLKEVDGSWDRLQHPCGPAQNKPGINDEWMIYRKQWQKIRCFILSEEI